MTIPETQLAAYEEIQPTLSDKRRAVFSLVVEHPAGLALFEIAELLGWAINCVSGRVTELADAGWLRDSGERRINPKTGKRAIVWTTAPRFDFDASGQGVFA